MKKLHVLWITALLLSGCASSKIYLVESTYVKDESGSEKKPEVTKTNSFNTAFDEISTIAVKAPDNCINETQSQAAGVASGRATILKEDCGVEMAMIETALAKRQYNVISWKVLQNEISVAAQNNQSVTHLEAAKRLGADALLLINSLERTKSSGATDARWNTRYYQSDERGRNKGPAEVTEELASNLNGVASSTKNTSSNAALSVTINAGVVSRTGQAIWFYEWNHLDIDKDNDAAISSVYAHCDKVSKDRYSCRKYMPQKEEKKKSKLTSGSSIAISASSNPEDMVKAKYSALTREVIANMIKSFDK